MSESAPGLGRVCQVGIQRTWCLEAGLTVVTIHTLDHSFVLELEQAEKSLKCVG